MSQPTPNPTIIVSTYGRTGLLVWDGELWRLVSRVEARQDVGRLTGAGRAYPTWEDAAWEMSWQRGQHRLSNYWGRAQAYEVAKLPAVFGPEVGS